MFFFGKTAYVQGERALPTRQCKGVNILSMAKFNELGFKVFPHPPNSAGFNSQRLFPVSERKRINSKIWLQRSNAYSKKNWINVGRFVLGSNKSTLRHKVLFFGKPCVSFKKSQTLWPPLIVMNKASRSIWFNDLYFVNKSHSLLNLKFKVDYKTNFIIRRTCHSKY